MRDEGTKVLSSGAQADRARADVAAHRAVRPPSFAERLRAVSAVRASPDPPQTCRPAGAKSAKGAAGKGRPSGGVYRLDDLRRDLALMFANARQYNDERSQLHQDVALLEAAMEAAAEEVAADEAKLAAPEDPAETARKAALAAHEARRPEKPKRPTTAFFAFGAERRATLKVCH
jgi:hypothetical protein